MPTAAKQERLQIRLDAHAKHVLQRAAGYRRKAVDGSQQGRGLGAYLLMDALERVYAVTQVVAMQALVVDACDEAAAAFYRKFGFVAFVDNRRRLFLPMATLRRLFAG